MRHLYASVVKVQRHTQSVTNGIPSAGLIDQPAPLDRIRCRIDLTFVRPGKDAPPVITAGKAPDRMGVMFCDANIPIRAGDTIVAISGPVVGTFEIKAVPDVAQGYSIGHHIEVQVIESSQNTSQIPGKNLA